MNFQTNGGVPAEDEIIAALAKAFGAPEAAAISWLAAIHLRFDARAAQERLVEREAAAAGQANPKTRYVVDMSTGDVQPFFTREEFESVLLRSAPADGKAVTNGR